MDVAVVVEQVQQVAAVRADDAAGVAELEAALRSVGKLQAWLAGTKAALTTKLAVQVSFPEKTIADCTRGSTRDAAKDKERADTLTAAPALAEALDMARLTAGHVDEVTRATKQLQGNQRKELLDRLDHGLLDVAAVATIEDWRRRLAFEVNNIRRDDGMERLERQRRATRMRSWMDGEGMWCISGRFDPVTGVKLAARLDQAVEALFVAATPDTCPTDPVEKQHHLRGLALVHLLTGTKHLTATTNTTTTGAAGDTDPASNSDATEHAASSGDADGTGSSGETDANGGTANIGGIGRNRPGRPEFVVVIDSSRSDGAGGPIVDWGIPVEIPHPVLADLMGDADVHTVVVRNGVVMHAPGRLDLGRTTRLANRAQRRALRAMYATCAIPGCSVRYDNCKLHHIVWWRNGGRTDLANLIPVCARHHSRIHDAGWDIGLGPNRELTIRLPDGTVRCTGPPSRAAA